MWPFKKGKGVDKIVNGKSEDWYINNADSIKDWSEHFSYICNFSDEFFDIFLEEMEEKTLFIWACKNQNTLIVDKLKKRGINLGKYIGFIFESANNGEVKIIDFLIDSGFDIHTKASNDMDLLNAASHKLSIIYSGSNDGKKKIENKLKICLKLIDKGCNPFYITDRLNNSAFHEICSVDGSYEHGFSIVRKILISCAYFDGRDLDVKNNKGYTPLMIAASNLRNETVDRLLKDGANPTLKNNDGETAASLCLSSQVYSFDDSNRIRISNKIMDYDRIFRSKYAPEVFKP